MPQLIERAVGRTKQGGQARAIASLDAPTGRPTTLESQACEVADARQGAEAAVGPSADSGFNPPTFQIPYEKLRRQGFISPAHRGSRLAEEIRFIKRHLMKEMASDGRGRAHFERRVIMVTSARAGEGKSFVALNLALSFAMDEGIPALLIDADHTGSTASDLLGVPNAPGLIEGLVEPRMPLGALARKSEGLPFTFLPPGRSVPSATALFGGAGMAELLRDAGRLDPGGTIVVDAPPLLSTTEAMELALRAGNILVVVEAGATSDAAVRSALDLLEPRANVSLVLNKAPRFAAFGNGYAREAAN